MRVTVPRLLHRMLLGASGGSGCFWALTLRTLPSPSPPPGISALSLHSSALINRGQRCAGQCGLAQELEPLEALEVCTFKVATSRLPKLGERNKGCVLAQTIWMETESGTEWGASKMHQDAHCWLSTYKCQVSICRAVSLICRILVHPAIAAIPWDSSIIIPTLQVVKRRL